MSCRSCWTRPQQESFPPSSQPVSSHIAAAVSDEAPHPAPGAPLHSPRGSLSPANTPSHHFLSLSLYFPFSLSTFFKPDLHELAVTRISLFLSVSFDLVCFLVHIAASFSLLQITERDATSTAESTASSPGSCFCCLVTDREGARPRRIWQLS